MKPAVLSEKQLQSIQSDSRYERNWIVQSLLETLMSERSEAVDAAAVAKLELMQARQELQWYETTYSARALTPLHTRKKGGLCAECGSRGATHIKESWCCLDCGRTWHEEVEGSTPTARESGSQETRHADQPAEKKTHE